MVIVGWVVVSFGEHSSVCIGIKWFPVGGWISCWLTNRKRDLTQLYYCIFMREELIREFPKSLAFSQTAKEQAEEIYFTCCV